MQTLELGGEKGGGEPNLTYPVFLPILNFSQPCGRENKKQNKIVCCPMKAQGNQRERKKK